MVLSDMDGLMKLKDAEGWNQLEQDWELLINYEESVNLVAVLDEQIVGTVTAINYDNMVAWIGMMLVDRDYRGKGISKLLLNDVIHKLKKCASIKLDATPAGKPVYLKMGFVEEYTLFRITNPSVSRISRSDFPVETEPLKTEDIQEVVKLDKKVFGADRTPLINRLYYNYPELSWIIRENSGITGYCQGRRGLNFTQIGPVYASSEKDAKALVRSAVNQITGQAVVVDLHADKPDMKLWLETCGFTTQRPFDRMYLKHNPHPGMIESQYLISGPELG